MASTDDKSSATLSGALPWSGIALALGVTVGAFYTTRAPLISGRPDGGIPFVASEQVQHVEARLWQDPFEAVMKHSRADHPHEPPTAALRGTSSDADPIVLAAMVDVSPYAESQEARLKARYAVLAALDVAGYEPVDDQHIGHFELPRFVEQRQRDTQLAQAADAAVKTVSDVTTRPPLPALDGAAEPPSDQDASMVPFERFRPDPLSEEASRRRDVLVLWLDDGAFRDAPLQRLAAVLHSAPFTGIRPRDFRIIGPASSNTLRTMLEQGWGLDRPQRRSAAAAMPIYSPFATADGDLLLLDKDPNALLRTPIRLLDDGSSAAGPTGDTIQVHGRVAGDAPAETTTGFRLVRTTTTDDAMAALLVTELDKRGLRFGDSVALVGEWDSFYGRALRSAVKSKVKQRWKVFDFSYLRGLDGALPKQAVDPKASKTSTSVTKAKYDVSDLERPEGASQLDYVRRLADRLHQLNIERTLAKKGEIRAIGVLGSDVYDKLLILQALRADFPRAVFFTTDLDARLLHPAQLPWTRNLIVASPFGLELSADIQKDIPPFRDSYQTALFYSVLQALHSPVLPDAARRGGGGRDVKPRIFEIGWHGAYDLTADADNDGGRIHPVRSAAGTRLIGKFLLAVLVTLLLVGVTSHTMRRELGRLWQYRRAILAVLVPTALLAVVIFAQLDGGEPLTLTEGISIWPSIILRWFGFLLCLFLVGLGLQRMRDNADEVASRFGLAKPAAREPLSKAMTLAFGPDLSIGGWKDECSTRGPRMTIEELWAAYLERGDVIRRNCRIIPVAVVFLLFGFAVLSISDRPYTPYRGSVAGWVNFVSLLLSVPAMVYLLYFVVDATRLCSAFVCAVSSLEDPAAAWRPSAKFAALQAERGMADGDVAQWLTIELIALRTTAVSQLILYPFIALFVMLLSRITYFDAFTFPLGLAAIFLALFVYALLCAVELSHCAERVRSRTLQRLRNSLLVAHHDGAPSASRVVQLGIVIDDIRKTVEGAFAPLSQHPIIRALLLPSSGVGLVAVLQYLSISH